jgi:putative ABC transport system permease protein
VSGYLPYVVRAQPGRLNEVMKATEQRLFEVSRLRVLEKVQPLSDARRESYQDDHGLVVILGVVCTALVAVTAFGIVGLTSYWVQQRRRQIGIRRALGATRQAILRYFQTENLMIAAAGSAVGVLLALGLNLWIMSSYQGVDRLHALYPCVGALSVLLLGQIAVLWPALRAASIPPALATRGDP